MGIVYSAETVESSSIPEDNVHERAARFLIDQLFSPFMEKEMVLTPDEGTHFGINSGLIYGSVPMGISNRRSDIDLLVNYHANCADKTLNLIKDACVSTEKKFHTKIEANILQVGALRSPLEHGIDPLFAQHLIAVQNIDEPRWSYNWPVEGLQSHRINFDDKEKLCETAIRYSSGKTRQFARAIVYQRGSADYQVLRRALELPNSIGRKVLAVIHGAEVPDSIISGDRVLSNQMVLSAIQSFGCESAEDLEEKTKVLAFKDKEYSDLLESTVQENGNVDDYKKWVESNYQIACKLAHDISEGWTRILKSILSPVDTSLTADSKTIEQNAEIY